MNTALNKQLKNLLVSGFVIFCGSQAEVSLAADNLSADQIRSLVADKTTVIYWPEKNINVEVYFSPDGTLAGENHVKKKIKGNWEITGDNLLCVASNFVQRTCGNMVANGDGTYNRFTDGVLTQTYKSFTDGNPKGYSN